MEEITKILTEDMGQLSSPDISIDSLENLESSSAVITESTSKKRKLFIDNRETEETSNFPQHLAQESISEKKVKDDFYLTVARLLGHGHVDKITEAKAEERAVTAAIDSTTKKGVGQFATQGISIG